jgi:hypothetical protein
VDHGSDLGTPVNYEDPANIDPEQSQGNPILITLVNAQLTDSRLDHLQVGHPHGK